MQRKITQLSAAQYITK